MMTYIWCILDFLPALLSSFGNITCHLSSLNSGTQDSGSNMEGGVSWEREAFEATHGSHSQRKARIIFKSGSFYILKYHNYLGIQCI